MLVGINPGLRSAALGHHFAGKGNPFWRLLFAAGLIDEPLTAEEDRRLAEFSIALTNVCPRPSRSADELTRAELLAGRNTLLRKCRAWRPEVMVLVGIGLYPVVFGRGGPPGPGPKPERVGQTDLFVLPNPSGLNASFPGFESKLVWFRQLAAFLKERERPPATRLSRPGSGPRRGGRPPPSPGAASHRP
jgi:TDG/mug DNA glycosylase family protein